MREDDTKEYDFIIGPTRHAIPQRPPRKTARDTRPTDLIPIDRWLKAALATSLIINMIFLLHIADQHL